MRYMYKYLDTRDGLTVVVQDRTYHIPAEAKNYEQVLKGVHGGLDPIRLLDVIEGEARKVKAAIQVQLPDSLTYNEGMIFYRGQSIHNPAVRRLLKMVDEGLEIAPLARFIEKQQLNPDPVVHAHLYEFLEFGRIPITQDGDFLAYKAVRSDYRDIHSGTFSNRPGDVCQVPRESVDPDRNQTCSRGLHVCSYAYLPHFSHADGHVMICKISPTDVVAIPSDYNNTKMRVCRYEVVEEVTTYYRDGKDELGEGPVLRSEDYEVWYETPGEGEEILDTFYTLEEAKRQADAALREVAHATRAWVEHADGVDEVLYEARS